MKANFRPLMIRLISISIYRPTKCFLCYPKLSIFRWPMARSKDHPKHLCRKRSTLNVISTVASSTLKWPLRIFEVLLMLKFCDFLVPEMLSYSKISDQPIDGKKISGSQGERFRRNFGWSPNFPPILFMLYFFNFISLS